MICLKNVHCYLLAKLSLTENIWLPMLIISMCATCVARTALSVSGRSQQLTTLARRTAVAVVVLWTKTSRLKRVSSLNQISWNWLADWVSTSSCRRSSSLRVWLAAWFLLHAKWSADDVVDGCNVVHAARCLWLTALVLTAANLRCFSRE